MICPCTYNYCYPQHQWHDALDKQTSACEDARIIKYTLLHIILINDYETS